MSAFTERWQPLADYAPSGLPVFLARHGTFANGRPRWRATLACPYIWDFQMVPERPVVQDASGRYYVSRTTWLEPPAAVREKYCDADPANALHWGGGG